MSIIEQESWNYYRDNNDFEKRSYVVFETKSKSLLSDIENGLKTHTSNNSNDTENQDRELQTLLETNMKLLMEKDKKTQEYSQQMVQYQNLKESKYLPTSELSLCDRTFLLYLFKQIQHNWNEFTNNFLATHAHELQFQHLG